MGKKGNSSKVMLLGATIALALSISCSQAKKTNQEMDRTKEILKAQGLSDLPSKAFLEIQSLNQSPRYQMTSEDFTTLSDSGVAVKEDLEVLQGLSK